MSFEADLSKTNADFFFREFTYSSNKFKPNKKNEYELADSVIWLDEILIVAQLKERFPSFGATVEDEGNWFRNEILDKAAKQVSDTVRYLNTYDSITLANVQGHEFNLANARDKHVTKLIIFKTPNPLPRDFGAKKFIDIPGVGVVHIISGNDYLGILDTLITPTEVKEYLDFRELVIKRWHQAIAQVSEQAIVGQFLRNLPEEPPSERFTFFLHRLQEESGNTDEWDIASIIHLFPERRTTPQTAPTDYYRILKELAKLNRTDMRLFKERFKRSMENAEADEDVRPYRFDAATGCGFLFIPLRRLQEPDKLQILKTLTALSKYERRLAKCVGLSFVFDGGSPPCDVHWCRLEYPWAENPEAETLLKENSFFRPIRESVIERYGIS